MAKKRLCKKLNIKEKGNTDDMVFVYSPGTPCSFFFWGQAILGTHLFQWDHGNMGKTPHPPLKRGVPRRDRHTSRGR